jgi:hypothetical protein
MVLKPIETRYAGHFFRSRAEARYAVFLDSLGVKWDYEPEGYRLTGVGKYLPDFYLPGLKAWVEVKGVEPSLDEKRKARALFEQGGDPVYIFFGGMLDPVLRMEPLRVLDGARAIGFDAIEAPTFVWVECRRCGAVGISGGRSDGTATRSVCSCIRAGVNPLSRYLKLAYAAARMARFEHEDYNHRAPRIRPMLRDTPTFTPAKARPADAPPRLRLSELQARWPSLRDQIWSTPIERATMSSCELVWADDAKLVIRMRAGVLRLLTDEKKRAIRGDLTRILGKGMDVVFIDDAAPYPPVSKWDGAGLGNAGGE